MYEEWGNNHLFKCNFVGKKKEEEISDGHQI